ncbi:hypothetical protein [Rhizobium sp. WCS2018Hpa-16]|uniref:hypothetical protein n=1 Tax=Rhizobium sp. WCS2018Hpa-16 TaxID=3073636 RepID=UPI00288A3E54|nr:hypothetical protein [Rhizobium sp. WCS2018Hpa-16]
MSFVRLRRAIVAPMRPDLHDIDQPGFDAGEWQAFNITAFNPEIGDNFGSGYGFSALSAAPLLLEIFYGWDGVGEGAAGLIVADHDEASGRRFLYHCNHPAQALMV